MKLPEILIGNYFPLQFVNKLNSSFLDYDFLFIFKVTGNTFTKQTLDTKQMLVVTIIRYV